MTKIMLELPVGNTNVTDLFDFSPALVEDLKQILASERYQGEKGHNLRSMSARFRVVLTACRFIIANDANAELLKQGFSGFVKEHFAFLKSIYRSDIRRELRNELVFAIGIYMGRPLLKHHYQSGLWAFYFKEQDAWRYIDSTGLKAAMPKVHAEMTSLLTSETDLLSQKSYSMETLHSRISKAKRLLLERLAPQFKNEFEEHGLQALSFDNNRIQKSLFQTIQSDVQQKSISLRTGTGYFETIRWLMELTGQKFVKAFRKYTGNWTFVLITDRTDLDVQIYKTFNSAGIVTENCQADSGVQLKALLGEDHRFVFTLIQKFKGDEKGSFPVLSERNDIIVITDEAHRSQYDSLAMNMRNALPNASFIAFTGTPLLAGEAKTQEVFGDYISIYNFADAVDDGATLPLYYENRVPEVSISSDTISEDIADILDQADLTEEQETRLETEFAKAYHIITRDDRLETIATDLVEHYINRDPFSDGMLGKAMVVSIDKATAIKMYDKVQLAWKTKLNSLKLQAKYASGSRLNKLRFQIEHMETTDMAVVVSGAQNDDERLAKKGLDYKSHRERFLKEKIDEKFKDPEDNLRIVFVCAMWLTGFDAPSVSTLYLDKPLKSHTLMQTIARANRVYEGKSAGQIVDYINIFSALQQALGLYGGGVAEDGTSHNVDIPAKNKSELVAALGIAINELIVFLNGVDIDLNQIVSAPADGFAKLTLLDNASEILLAPKNKEEFTSFLRQINRIFKAIMPDDSANQYVPYRVAINIIYSQMRLKSGLSIDDEDVLDVIRNQVNELLDESISTIKIQSNLPEPVNIANIDFDALATMVAKIDKPKQSDAEKLKNLIERKLQPMVLKNKTRQDLQKKFQELIEAYNLGAYTAEEFFNRLKEFINDLEHEEKRTVREGLTEEQLAVYDLMIQKTPLTDKERNKVKEIAKILTEKIQDILVIDWRKKQRTKARVKNMIEKVLDSLPDSYDDELWPKTCREVYMHIFEKYSGQEQSPYTN